METIRRETSDGQISDDQTGSVVCGVCSPIYGGLHGGMGFFDCT